MDEEPASGRVMVVSFAQAEDAFCDLLQTIPYCQEHEHVWSPKLVTILMECCSQLDSLLKFESGQANATIADHFARVGKELAGKWAVFWAEQGQRLWPFKAWLDASEFGRDSYTPLDWWQAYNDVKHNRIANRSKATLACTAQAMAGLFLAIATSRVTHTAMAEANWLSGHGDDLAAWLSEEPESVREQKITIESRLFTYIVAWTDDEILRWPYWLAKSSYRFAKWYNEYHRQLREGAGSSV